EAPAEGRSDGDQQHSRPSAWVGAQAGGHAMRTIRPAKRVLPGGRILTSFNNNSCYLPVTLAVTLLLESNTNCYFEIESNSKVTHKVTAKNRMTTGFIRVLLLCYFDLYM